MILEKLEKEHAADVNDILRKHETEKLGYVTKINSLLQQIDDLGKKVPPGEDKFSDIRGKTLNASTNTLGFDQRS